MAKVDILFREKFENKLVEMYPDVATSGSVTRPQLMDVMKKMKTDKYPVWLMKNKLGRGVYAVGNTARVVDNVVELPKHTEPVAVSVSMIPAKDPNYVPFGNHKDVDSIIKSGLFYPTYITCRTSNVRLSLRSLAS